MTDDELKRIESQATHVRTKSDMLSLIAEVRRLRAELAAAPRWVPVTEVPSQNPVNWREVFLALLENNELVIATFEAGKWLVWDIDLGQWVLLYGVTHWTRIPPPPVKD